MDGLTRLEYRGYDSAGVAVLENGKINVVKAQGTLQALREKLKKHPLTGHIGIGHTRWATHGEPSDENSHPHLSQSEEIAVVHNGIIENYAPLRQRLANKGYRFIGQTDTEVFAQLLEETLGSHNDILTAVRAALEKIEGSYGLGVLCSRFPDRIIAARKDSPLIVGLGEDGNYIASDIPAILPYTRRVYLLEEGEMAQVFADHVEIYDMDGERLEKEVYEVTWSVDAAERGGYPHFMLKEIYDQGRAMRDTISPRVKSGRFDLTEAGLSDDVLKNVRRVVITACGTASYAGQVGRVLIEKLCRVPVEIDVASRVPLSRSHSESGRSFYRRQSVGRNGGYAGGAAPCKVPRLPRAGDHQCGRLHHRTGGGSCALYLGGPGDCRGAFNQGLYHAGALLLYDRAAHGAGQGKAFAAGI